jgi:hypothetical protein
MSKKRNNATARPEPEDTEGELIMICARLLGLWHEREAYAPQMSGRRMKVLCGTPLWIRRKVSFVRACAAWEFRLAEPVRLRWQRWPFSRLKERPPASLLPKTRAVSSPSP